MLPVRKRKVVSQACDACRRRKTKCNGLQPCLGCISAGLGCTFELPQKRGGNQGTRATVLNGLRENQESNASISPGPSLASPNQQVFPGITAGRENTIIDACIGAYMERIHPVVPFLNREILDHQAGCVTDSPLSRQFIAAFCAYVLTFGSVSDRPALAEYASDSDLVKRLLGAALIVQAYDPIYSQSHLAIFISFFLYGAHAGLGDYRQGWFYLREATTLFILHGARGDPTWFSSTIRARLFWILVVSERSHGIRKSRPITIQITPESPPLDEPEEIGLRYLANIFRPFDELFFAVWNGSRQECSKDWLLSLEKDVRAALPGVLDVPNEQIANLRVTQLWLQIKLWELFPRFGFLSSESVYECLTFRYPIILARDLTILTLKLPITSLQIHGIGMTEKVFDIACALADILPFVPTTVSQLELGLIDYLTQTASLLSKLPGGSPKFVPLLLAKVNEMFPELVRPICEAVQLPVSGVGPLSPNSRYTYEEEVRMSLYRDLRRGR